MHRNYGLISIYSHEWKAWMHCICWSRYHTKRGHDV